MIGKRRREVDNKPEEKLPFLTPRLEGIVTTFPKDSMAEVYAFQVRIDHRSPRGLDDAGGPDASATARTATSRLRPERSILDLYIADRSE